LTVFIGVVAAALLTGLIINTVIGEANISNSLTLVFI